MADLTMMFPLLAVTDDDEVLEIINLEDSLGMTLLRELRQMRLSLFYAEKS